MINKLSNHIINIMLNSNLILEDQVEIYFYGVQMLISTFINIIISLLLGWKFGYIQGTLVFLLFFCILRSNVGGFHCNTHKKCIFCFTLIYTLTLSIHRFLIILPHKYYLMTSLLCVTLIYILAPVEDPNRPIKNNEFIIFKTRIKKVIFIELFCSLILLKSNFYPFTTYSFFWVAIIISIGKIKNCYLDRRYRHD